MAVREVTGTEPLSEIIPDKLRLLLEVALLAEPVIFRAEELDLELYKSLERFWASGGARTVEGWDVLENEILPRVTKLECCATCSHCRVVLSRHVFQKVILYENLDVPLLYCDRLGVYVQAHWRCEDYDRDDEKARRLAELVKTRLTVLELCPWRPRQ